MQSAVKSLLGLFTNTSASVWKTVVQPLANMALLSSDSCTTTAAAGSLLGAKSKEEEEEEESSHPCLMKITRTDQRGKKVQTSNHSGNEHSGSGVDEVDQPKMQNQQQQITQGVDMELLLKSLAITLQTMLHNALRRVHSISYLMDSQLLLQVENNRLEVYRCQYQARLQLLKLQQRQHSTEPALLMHCQKSQQQQQQQPKYSLSLRFQCQCQISSLSYDIDDQREHIIDRQSGRLLPVPLSLGPVGREPVSLVLRHHLAKI